MCKVEVLVFMEEGKLRNPGKTKKKKETIRQESTTNSNHI